MTQSEEHYPEPVIGFLEMLWGRGWLSPGGPEELSRLLDNEDLRGRHVLDIGCGAGGIDCLLVSQYGAARVTGIDVEASVLAAARARTHRSRRVRPGGADAGRAGAAAVCGIRIRRGLLQGFHRSHSRQA